MAPVSATTRSFRAALAFAGIGILLGSPAGAQPRNRVVAQADSAFAAGDVALADSLYYLAVRYWPRDPHARAALGRYLGAQGKAKPASILLEEARMFGADPVEVGRDLAPLYERLGEWRALLTLPGSPLSIAERRRAAWLSEHPFIAGDGGAATIIGSPSGDTIARVAARIGGKTVVAAILASDAGFVVGTRLAEHTARGFEGDPTVVILDSMTVAQVRLANVPALLGTEASTLTLGATALGRVIVQIDYARKRIAVTRTDAAAAQARHPLIRVNGEMRVLDRGRWIPLASLAAATAKASKTLVIDVAAGEVRVRP